jgi:hypothetical protein
MTFEILRNIITTPIVALISVIILWGILHLILVKRCNLSPTGWIRLEYFWIGIGLLGVLALVDENRKKFQFNELEKLEIWIKNESMSLLNFSNSQMHCFQYNNSADLPQNEFDKRQAHSDSICNWAKKIGLIVESSIKSGNQKIINIPILQASNKLEEFTFVQINKEIIEINSKIERRDELVSAANDNFWEGYKYSFGIFLMLLAFSIRLTIVSKKVQEKKHIKLE